MRADLTRRTFRPDRGYSAVLVQQGRVQLDADANEASDIGLHRARTTANDVVGSRGVPRDGDGFLVVAEGDDLLLTPGRLYVDGILVEAASPAVELVALGTDTAELAALGADGWDIETCQWLALRAEGVPRRLVRVTDVTAGTRTIAFTPALAQEEADALTDAGASATRVPSYTSQPHLPGPPQTSAGDPCPTLDLAEGVWAAYVDVWERAVTAREDPRLREPALGGPDTAARSQVVWQLRLEQLAEDAAADVACELPPPTPPGGLQARAQPDAAVADDCEVPAGAGYRRLENQLYRVEVHDGTAPGPATFKWSRENASVAASWQGTAARTLVVDSVGSDVVRGFGPGDVVELTDRARELAGRPGVFVEVERVDDAGLHLAADPPPREEFDDGAVVLRWDDPAGPRPIERPAEDDGWLPLEEGVQVRFTATGGYRTGDHWLVPARTATRDVEWPRDAADRETPLVRPPDGAAHHRCVLALVRRPAEGPLEVTDCRPRFPPLTDLLADDVALHPGLCDLPDGATVQEALEALCQQRDLRHHNRHLHGWGIVCGLQVSCGPDEGEGGRAHVTVREGYAIDPTGRDVLQGEETVDVLALVEQQAPDALDETGDGDVCLNLVPEPGAPARFEVEPYRRDDDPLSSVLSGTLLADFYLDCIEPIQQFLEEELTPPEDEGERGVHPARERVAALTNLIVQPVNPTTGQHVFVSPREHEVLGSFYAGLRARLRSETFCAMFDDARPFPDYPLDELGLDTIFGRGSHERLRLRPGGREAYTVGPGLNPAKPVTSLNRYDLRRRTLVATIDPLAGADLGDGGDSGAGAVQDVAFSPDGRLVYVIAPTRNGANTFFRAGTIQADGIAWQPVVTICGIRLVTLASTAADPGMVYAVGVVDGPPEEGAPTRAGLYRIQVDSVDPNMEPIARFNAFGHLRITPDGRAFATAAAESQAPLRYSRVLHLSLPGGRVVADFPVPEGIDDLAIRPARGRNASVRVYTVAGPHRDGTKSVVAHDLSANNTATIAGEVEVDDSTIRVEVFEATGNLLVTSEDGYSLRLVTLDRHALVAGYLLPMQVGPIALAVTPDGRRAVVLNSLSNTLLTAEAEVLDARFDTAGLLADLAEYRASAIEAFADLLGGFLQYLKDCLCDKFLVDCPEEETGTLSLACVSIRGGQVHRVCNFSRRRYVKSFPTVEYWLSAVPVLPLLRKAFDEFCGAVLPGLFRRYTVPREADHTGTGRVKVGTARAGVGEAQAFDITGRLFRTRNAVTRSSDLVVDDISRSGTPGARRRAGTSLGTLVGQPAERVEEVLLDRGFEVRRRPYEPDALRHLTTHLPALLRTPTPGAEITMEVEHDQVRSFSVSGAPEAVDLRRRVASLTEAVAARDAELAEVRAATEAQQVRLREVASLRDAVAAGETRLAERDERIGGLLERLEVLESRPVQPTPEEPAELAELRSEVDELRTFRDRVQRFMDERE